MSDKPLDPGELTCRITYRYLTTAEGPLGEPLPNVPVVVGKAWAKAEPISNKKVRTADQDQVIETCLFTCYPRRDVQIDWQIETRDRVLTVRAVDRSKSDRIVITGEADSRHD